MRERGRFGSFVCALAVVGLFGCAEDVAGGGTESSATVCTVVGTTWWNQTIAAQSGRFHAELYATPSAANIDGVIGLSNGAATKWSSLAAIVRFAPDGRIDARAGGEYRADQLMQYERGVSYWIRIDVDAKSHTYSVWVSRTAGEYSPNNQLARDYPFRTEQSAVTQLNNVASFVNPQTGAGTLQVCGLNINADATTADGCLANDASRGFKNYAVAPGVTSMIVDVAGRVSTSGIDSVIGLAQGDVDAYSDLAASIRFWTNGNIEARDGDTYRADVALAYQPGAIYKFKFVVDLANKTYSVFVDNPATSYDAVELAHAYRFRPQQAAATTLDRVATTVATTTGHLDACDPRNVSEPALQFALEGSYWMAPMPDDGIVVAGGLTWPGQMMRLDAQGKVLASMPGGGQMATDTAGNIYLAQSSQTSLTITSYTPAFARRWSRTFPSNGFVNAIGVASNNWTYIWAGTKVHFVNADATAAGDTSVYWSSNESKQVGIGGGGFVVASWTAQGTTFTAYGTTGAQRWTRFFAGNYDVQALAMVPDGSVAIGGQFYADINFGDGTMYTGGNENGSRNAFLVVLDGAGNFRFSRRLTGSAVHYVATNGKLIVTSNQNWTQSAWLTLQVFDTVGNHVHDWVEEGFGFGDNGNTYNVAMTSSGRIFASMAVTPWYPSDGTGWQFLVALKP
jgi:hypothetical protein